MHEADVPCQRPGCTQRMGLKGTAERALPPMQPHHTEFKMLQGPPEQGHASLSVQYGSPAERGTRTTTMVEKFHPIRIAVESLLEDATSRWGVSTRISANFTG